MTNAPTSLSITGNSTGLSQANLTWSPPTSSSPVVHGYEVFYESSNGQRQGISVGNSTSVMLDGLDPEKNYSIFVVSYGGDLPSAASDMVDYQGQKLMKIFNLI